LKKERKISECFKNSIGTNMDIFKFDKASEDWDRDRDTPFMGGVSCPVPATMWKTFTMSCAEGSVVQGGDELEWIT
jgi:hypothetical protein